MTGAAKNRKPVLLLSGLVLGMFAFGFALVPLYNLVCQALGIQTATTAVAVAQPTTAGVARPITVKFDTTVNSNLPWQFKPLTRRLDGQTGQLLEARFQVQNSSASALTGQAIPSITPWQATEYVQKIECFCFDQQKLAAGETREVVLRFIVSPQLPERFSSLTVSYTYMNPASPVATRHQPADGG